MTSESVHLTTPPRYSLQSGKHNRCQGSVKENENFYVLIFISKIRNETLNIQYIDRKWP